MLDDAPAARIAEPAAQLLITAQQTDGLRNR
jgi:hypothetical protein